MSIEMLIVLAIFLVGVLYGWATLPRYWRGQRAEMLEHGFAVWAVLGDGVRRGVVRALLAALIGGTFLFGFGVLNEWSQSATGSVREVVDRLTDGFAIAALLMLLPFFGIIFFNRPKFMVPPYLRDERGALMPSRHRSVPDD